MTTPTAIDMALVQRLGTLAGRYAFQTPVIHLVCRNFVERIYDAADTDSKVILQGVWSLGFRKGWDK